MTASAGPPRCRPSTAPLPRRRSAQPLRLAFGLLWASAALAALVACLPAGPGFSGATAWSGASGPSPRQMTRRFAEPVAVVERPLAEVEPEVSQREEDNNPRLTGLALMLDDGTRKSHSMAENTQFVTGFFKGLGDRASFSQLVTSLYFVYQAMEKAFEATADTQVQSLDFPELRRVASLEEDLAYFYGPNWRAKIEPSMATRRYCERVTQVASESPTLLVAHQYTRYLGDLFGGQMMGGMASSSLGLEGGLGTSFYNFRDISDNKAFITQWYAKLNELELSAAEKEAIVEEANLVFRLNIDIFEELEGSPLAAAWQLFSSFVRSSIGLA